MYHIKLILLKPVCIRFVGVSTLAATNPIWVVKTRMCLQPSVYNATNNPEHYNGIIGMYNHLCLSFSIFCYNLCCLFVFSTMQWSFVEKCLNK